ncbi:hypothetical protein JRO89_XS01G0262100 [Xanthoceras sorbifolium]|uniref:Oligopeptide transporter n=1 Tax=Xanthoceras sorbifolium TaxID=99658 RepID=A0ABQ8ILE3_9ROSI|nr:hypothetical protein JRO89_XS01G0262100 [Xanthoceras sorbifolium]
MCDCYGHACTDGDEITDDSPIEQVRLTVPTTDDPTLPALTFRTWVLGPITCAILAFVSLFFLYRQNIIIIPDACVLMLLLALGKLMASTLPSKPVKVPGTRWSFSTNPGPFDLKQNGLLTVLATSGLDSPYAVTIMAARKIYYKEIFKFLGWITHDSNNPVAWLWLCGNLYEIPGIKSLQCGALSPYLVYLSTVEVRPKSGVSKFQFFLIATAASFAYAVVPGYFFPTISALSIVCWFRKNSVTAQLISSGRRGFAIGSFAFDWNAISSYLPNPLVFPMSTIINNAIGLLLLYVICPIAYWTDSNNARHFPFFSQQLFDKSGHHYNVSKVLNKGDLTFNQKGYENYSDLYMSVVYLFLTGFDFASITATLSHFVVFHAREVWQQFKQAYLNSNATIEDVHNRLMKKYDPVPQWWFYAIIVSGIFLGILSCEGFGKQLQLPYWGILLACLLVMIFLLPLGVLQATTGQVSLFSLSSLYH